MRYDRREPQPSRALRMRHTCGMSEVMLCNGCWKPTTGHHPILGRPCCRKCQMLPRCRMMSHSLAIKIGLMEGQLSKLPKHRSRYLERDVLIQAANPVWRERVLSRISELGLSELHEVLAGISPKDFYEWPESNRPASWQ